jgi:hypothetical protein
MYYPYICLERLRKITKKLSQIAGAPHVNVNNRYLALTSPTNGGRSVGIIRWRTKAAEFFIGTGKDLCDIQPLILYCNRHNY